MGSHLLDSRLQVRVLPGHQDPQVNDYGFLLCLCTHSLGNLLPPGALLASGLDAVAEDDTFHAAFVAIGTEVITPLFQFDTPTGSPRNARKP